MRESLAVSHTVFVIPFLIRRTHPVLSILSVEAIRNSRERIKKNFGSPRHLGGALEQGDAGREVRDGATAIPRLI